MLELVTEKPPVVDSLQACVETVLDFHHRRIDLAGLDTELPELADRWTIATLPSVAERLECSLQIVKSDSEQLLEIRTPVILPLSKNEFAVALPGNEGRPDIVMPGQPPQLITGEHIDLWCTGRVIVMVPLHGVTATATEHMHSDRQMDWFWQPILKFTPNFAEVALSTVFINFLVIALPLFTLNVYDAVVPNLAMSTLTVLALGVFIAIVFDVLLKSARSSILERIAAKTGVQFDSKLMQRLLSIREEKMQLSVGERCNLFRELQGLRDFYATRLVPALVDFPFFLLFLCVIYLISPALTLVPIGVAIAILVLNACVQIPVKRSTRALFSSTQEKSSMMVEMLSGSVSLKQLNATGASLNRWSITAEQAAEVSRKSQRWVSIGQHGSLGLMQLNHVLIVVVGVYQIQGGSLTVGGLVASTILASRTIAPIMNLHSVVARWTQSRDCLRTIDELFDTDVDRCESRVLPRKELLGNIELKDFTYCYPDQINAAVKSVDISIKAGEHLCLIGPSGAGKSTLARVIAGALTSDEGRISIDGYDYKALTAARLRSSIALIPQNPFFIAGTVRENLMLGISHCSENQLEKACVLSGLDKVLSDTGSGLDTDSGENGNYLSGGQKQALSIARAILRDSKVLVFDEPTNGLDSALEKQFMCTMKSLLKQRTLIMVTHRMSLLPLVDRVIVMDSGSILADDKTDVVMQRFAA